MCKKTSVRFHVVHKTILGEGGEEAAGKINDVPWLALLLQLLEGSKKRYKKKRRGEYSPKGGKARVHISKKEGPSCKKQTYKRIFKTYFLNKGFFLQIPTAPLFSTIRTLHAHADTLALKDIARARSRFPPLRSRFSAAADRIFCHL